MSVTVATWNVQGLTETISTELILHLRGYRTDVLAVQETRRAKAEVYHIDGYLFVLSGEDTQERTWTRVGFMTAPKFRCRVQAYKQISGRLAWINCE